MPPALGTSQTLARGERPLQISKAKGLWAGYGRRRFLGCGFRHRLRPRAPAVGPKQCVRHLARGKALFWPA
jgi:hypothetical protein